VRQLVDEHDLRRAGEHGVDVELGEDDVAVGEPGRTEVDPQLAARTHAATSTALSSWLPRVRWQRRPYRLRWAGAADLRRSPVPVANWCLPDRLVEGGREPSVTCRSAEGIAHGEV
jgi:hypothetical protein